MEERPRVSLQELAEALLAIDRLEERDGGAALDETARKRQELRDALCAIEVLNGFLISYGIRSSVLARHHGLLGELYEDGRALGYLAPRKGSGGRPRKGLNEASYIGRLLGCAEYVRERLNLSVEQASEFVLRHSSGHPFRVTAAGLTKWRPLANAPFGAAGQEEPNRTVQLARDQLLMIFRAAEIPEGEIGPQIRKTLASAAKRTART